MSKKERQSYKCSILENGRISNFGNVEAMANHLKVCPQKMRRWRRALVKANTPLVRNYGTVYIDFAPKQL